MQIFVQVGYLRQKGRTIDTTLKTIDNLGKLIVNLGIVLLCIAFLLEWFR